MNEEKLGPMPDPEVTPPQDHPGGPDAIDDDHPYASAQLTRQLDPARNPAVEERVPDEIREPDEKSQEPTSDGASEPEKESPA